MEFACRHTGAKDAIVIGHSAGGHLALWLASRPPRVAGVIALGAVASPRLAYEQNLSNGAAAELLGSPGEFPERYAFADPCGLAASVPRILVHGAADDIVPIEHSRAYVKAQGGELVEISGGDHFVVVEPETVLPQVRKLRPLS